MKRLINLSAILALSLVFTTAAFAQDENQNTNQNRKMVKAQTMQATGTQSDNWVDADGDGICDNFGTERQGQGNGKGYGLKDGSGAGLKPQDGTGFGKMNGAGNGIGDGTGTGAVDGSGQASRRRGGRN